MKAEIDQRLSDTYEIAVLSAANETGLDDDRFPESCEYSLAEILDEIYPD